MKLVPLSIGYLVGSLVRRSITALCASVVATACLTRPVAQEETETRYQVEDHITYSPSNKLDLLFVVDSSSSMFDKRELLGSALPALVDRLANPLCVDGDGNRSTTPSPHDYCPPGANREREPFTDVNVGVIASDLSSGVLGEACLGESGSGESGSGEPASMDVRFGDARFVDSVESPDSASVADAGISDAPGFLTWSTYDDGPGPLDAFRTQVSSVGTEGCGYEAPLEAMYRFLADPEPWSELENVDCEGDAPGTGGCRHAIIPEHEGVRGDPTILAQRAAFLRPDSLVLVVVVSDENDCSLRAELPERVPLSASGRMFRGSDACAADPNDACCYSCGTEPPTGCAGSCDGARELPEALDPPNLRCFEQKRRFGVDLLYPPKRYVNALSQRELGLCNDDLDTAGCDEDEIRTNPLFDSGDRRYSRDASLVFLAGVVGVPWQLIRAETSNEGQPYPVDELHYQTRFQLSDSTLGEGTSTWDRLVGDVSVRDPHLIEAVASLNSSGRPGLPTAATPGADEIHGHEWFGVKGDELQYACTFELGTPFECNGPDFQDGSVPCECRNAGATGYVDGNPLCYGDGGYTSLQRRGKAFPSLRQLEVLRGVGETIGTAIVGSMCARNVTGDPLEQDFGFNPILDPLTDRLVTNAVGRCFQRRLEPTEQGPARRGPPACQLLEVTYPEGTCECLAAEARVAATASQVTYARAKLEELGDNTGFEPCVCAISPAGGSVDERGGPRVTDVAAHAECQTNERPRVNGWCYIDRDVSVITGDAADEVEKDSLLSDCYSSEKRLLRIAGPEGRQKPGSNVFIACEAERPGDVAPVDAGATAP